MKNPFKKDQLEVSDVVDARVDKLNALVDDADQALDGKVNRASEMSEDEIAMGYHANLTDEGVFEQNNDRGPFISTLSGAKFFVNECNVQEVPMVDVANALALNCRFNGHITRHYSVAEHSVLVSNLVSPENALYGLLHDYAEAFISDIPRPFKKAITGHDEFEREVMANVCNLYGLPLDVPEDVAYIDTHICAVEATVLSKVVPDWVKYYDPNVCPMHMIKGLSHIDARNAFITRFNELTG